MSDRPKILVCPPDFYDVEYEINPWMEGNIHRPSRELAFKQWKQLCGILGEKAELSHCPPHPGLPDMVFIANAGLVLGNDVVLSRFMHKERQPEERYFKEWFEKEGYKIHELPEDLPFEGAGDALFDRERGWLWAGYGFRSELDSHPLLAQWVNIEVLSLRLIDERFYHLDTCFCPLEGGCLIYYPPAFDAYSNRLIEMRIPASQRIIVQETDAINFACNAVNLDKIVILNKAGDELQDRLRQAGFDILQTPLTEFMKAGGAARCLTLRLNEPVRPPQQNIGVLVESRILKMEGHLLDSGLLERALDSTVKGGGSFQILTFDLGKQRQSTSKAEIKISAPSTNALEKIIAQLIDLGAVLPEQEISNVTLKNVTQSGVAPDDFYASTIYPTEIRVHDQWVPVIDQRMDGVIVVDQERQPASACCKLLRDLVVDDNVVVGIKGLRTVRKTESRDLAGEPHTSEEFSFMGAGVSSERRVELVVNQIAWEMRRIRDQGGKVAVVAGPVVIHTGGGEHLATLIRHGYVQALLGGNAIAVHDIEQALLGTSLGVDLKRGVSVRGGHKHHLKVINIIRRCGSISAAVEQGVLASGIFFECVQNKVPFSLAGSIRDDGPLPDTIMDLVQAQKDYAEMIRGAEMILMLSTMLHSIGVGNMTPAGVKLVCVDINPAVVTKLSDRGSLESVGVVTDIGLFLSLLVDKLKKLGSLDSAAEKD